MKILRVEQFTVADDSLKKVEMPTPTEIELAALNLDGKPLLQYWFEFSEKLQNKDGSKIRNRSGVDVFNSLDSNGQFPLVRQFDDKGVMTTQYRSYVNLPFDSNQYTLFAVFKIPESMNAGTNTSLVGQNNHADGSVNGPTLNITASGDVRIFKTGITTSLVYKNVENIKTKLQLVTVTQSPINGTGMRVNKKLEATNVYPTAKEPTTVKSMKILGGSTTLSANFNGSVAAIIICPKDLTNTVELDMIEDYLFKKYCS